MAKKAKKKQPKAYKLVKQRTILVGRRKRFCQEYVIDFNPRDAAIRAGYAVASAPTQASLLLDKDHIKDYINELLGDVKARTGVTEDKVINELANIAFANLKDYEKAIARGGLANLLKTISHQEASAISSLVETTKTTKNGDYSHVRIKLADKLRALEMLGRHLRMFEDKPDDATVPGVGISVASLKSLTLAEKQRVLVAIREAKENAQQVDE